MTDDQIEEIRAKLSKSYPGSHVKVAEDKCEIIVEESDGFAVAVIEKSIPHFHQKMQEVYRVLSGILYVECKAPGARFEQGRHYYDRTRPNSFRAGHR